MGYPDIRAARRNGGAKIRIRKGYVNREFALFRLTFQASACIIFALISKRVGRYPSGQRGQTVNLLADAFGGSNPPLPTISRALGPS